MDHKLQEVASDIEVSAAECGSEMRERTTELCNTVEDFARREPIKALAIAGGLGLVVGLLISRR